MAELLSEQLIEENPVLAAARVNSSPVPAAPTIEFAAPPSITFGSSATPTPAAPTSVSQSASVTSKVIAENEEGIDTNSVIAAITQGVEEGKALTVQRANQLVAKSRAESAGAAAVKDAARSKAIIVAQEDVANREVDLNKNEIFNTGGGVNEIVKLSASLKDARVKVQKENQDVSKLTDTEIGKDGFFKWLAAGLALPEQRDQRDQAVKSYSDLNTMKANFLAMQPATTAALTSMRVLNTEATAAANQQMIKQLADVKAAELNAKAAASNAIATQAVLTMSDKQARAEMDKWKILAETETRRLSEAARQLMVDKTSKDRRVMDTWIDGVLAGRVKTGIPVYTGTDLELIQQERNQVEARISAGGDMQEGAMAQFEFGIGTQTPTLYQTLNRISLEDDDSLINGAEKNKAKAILQTAFEEVVTASRGTETTPKFKLDSTNTPQLVNDIAQAKFDAFDAEIKEGDATNPNQAPPLLGITQMPAIAALKPVQEVIAPLLVGDTKDLTPSTVFQLVFSGMKTEANPEGKYNFNEAVEAIEAIYVRAGVYNTEAQMRTVYNLPAQTSYNAKIEVGKILSSNRELTGRERSAIASTFNRLGTVDLTDRTMITPAALKYLSAVSGGAEFRSLSQEASGTTGFGGKPGTAGKEFATQDLLDQINKRGAQ